MIPTYISCVILKPGARYSFGDYEPGSCSIDAMLGYNYYSVTRDKIVADGDEFVDNDGVLDETLFMVTDIKEIESFGHDNWPWLVDYMACTGYEDLEEGNMKVLYQTAMSLIPRDCKELVTHVSFIGLWEVETTYLSEEGYTEIDQINYVGPGKVILQEGG